MRCRGPLRVVLVLLVMALPPSTAFAGGSAPSLLRGPAEAATFVLKDGTKFESVTYEVNTTFDTVALHGGAKTVHVSFSDVEEILDASGANIAPRLLGSRYRPSGLSVSARGGTSRARMILLKSGKKLERVFYVANTSRREIMVYSGSRTRVVPYDDIESVLDEAGTDVTPQALASAAPADSFAHVRQPPTTPSTRPELPWRAALTADAGVDLPFGDYYDGTTGGFGVGFTGHLALNRHLALRGNVGLLGVDYARTYGVASLDPRVAVVSQDYDIDAWRYSAGIEYYEALSRWAPTKGFWFAHSAVGAIRHRMSGRATIVGPGGTEEWGFETTDTRFSMTTGLGLVYRVQPRVALTLSTDLDAVWTKVRSRNGGTWYDVRGFVVGVRAGLGWVL